VGNIEKDWEAKTIQTNKTTEICNRRRNGKGWTKKITPTMTIAMLCPIRTRLIPYPMFLLAIPFLSRGSSSTLKMEIVSSSETVATSTKHTVLHTGIP
jgi:hypothetical protein